MIILILSLLGHDMSPADWIIDIVKVDYESRQLITLGLIKRRELKLYLFNTLVVITKVRFQALHRNDYVRSSLLHTKHI